MSDSALAGVLGPADLHAALPPKTRERVDRAAIDAEAFRRGDPECFRVVLKRFGPIIRSVVRSYAKNADDQEDLYQEVSVRLLTQRSRYEDCGAMPGWITRVAHCACRNWCAARKARKSALERYAAELIPHEESVHCWTIRRGCSTTGGSWRALAAPWPRCPRDRPKPSNWSTSVG